MGKTLADGYLELRIDSSKLDPELRAAIKKVPFKSHGDKAGRDMGDGFAKGFADRGGVFAKTAATMASKLAIMTGAAASAAPSVVNLTAALLPAAGAMAALPVAMLAAKAASATLKVATAGVGEAITAGLTGTAKQADKAMKDLPPSARVFAKEVIRLKKPLDDLRESVSGSFFAPLSGEVTKLARSYVPLLGEEMSNLANSLGNVGATASRSLRSFTVMKGVRDLFGFTDQAVLKLEGSIRPLTKAAGAFVSATAPFLPKMAAGFTNGASAAARFVEQASKSGKVAEVVTKGIATLKQLGAILLNVGSIFRAVFVNATARSEGLLGNLEKLTEQVAVFLWSAQGESALQTTFATLAKLGEALRRALGAVLPAIASSVTALMPAVAGLAGPFADIVVALAPLLPSVVKLAAIILTSLTPAIQGLATWLGQNESAVNKIAIALGTAVVAIKAYELWVKASAVATKAAAVAQTIWNSNIVVGTRMMLIDLTAWIRSTAAKISNTTATVANRIAIAGTLATTKVFTVIQNLEIGAWIRSTAAKVASTAATIASTIATKAAAIASKAFAIGQWLVNAALTANPIGIVVVAIGALVAAIIYAYRNNETFRKIVDRVWAGIKLAIQGAWIAIKPVFNALKGFIMDTLPMAFRKGTDWIKKSWESVKEAARKPVAFVVNKVINPLIGGINTAADWVGIKKDIPLIKGFSTGGRLPGYSERDNMLATGPGGKPVALAGGEWVVNPRSSRKHDALLREINDDSLPGYADGGIVDFLTGPAKWLKGKVGGGLDSLKEKFGGSGIGQMVGGMAQRVIGGATSFFTNLINRGNIAGFGEAFAGAAGKFGLTGKMTGAVNMIKAAFPGMGVISGLRPGAITVTGRKSYHGMGRATDWPASMPLFNFMRMVFGRIAKEIIYSPAGGRQIHNGRDHFYTGAVRNTHWDHVHLALNQGGRVPLFDSGGTLAPGMNTVYNGTGGPEPLVRADRQGAARIYNINLTVGPGAHPAEVGRRVVESIKEFEAVNGKRWRS